MESPWKSSQTFFRAIKLKLCWRQHQCLSIFWVGRRVNPPKFCSRYRSEYVPMSSALSKTCFADKYAGGACIVRQIYFTDTNRKTCSGHLHSLNRLFMMKFLGWDPKWSLLEEFVRFIHMKTSWRHPHCLKSFFGEKFFSVALRIVTSYLQKFFLRYRASMRKDALPHKPVLRKRKKQKRRQVSSLYKTVSLQIPHLFQLCALRLSSWAPQPPLGWL
jgi:hypothetical protein